MFYPTENLQKGFYNLHWVKEKDLHEYCPQILWPNYRSKVELFEKVLFREFIRKFKTNSDYIVLKKDQNKLSLQRLENQELYMSPLSTEIQDQILSKTKWQIKDCLWNPYVIQTDSFINRTKLISEVFQKISTIKLINVYEKEIYSKFENKIRKILTFLIQNRNTTIKFNTIDLYDIGLISNKKVNLKPELLIFIQDGILIPIKVNCKEINIFGNFKIQIIINSTEWTILELTEIQSNELTLKYDSEENVLKSKSTELLQELGEIKHNRFVIFKSACVSSIVNPDNNDYDIIESSNALTKTLIIKHLHSLKIEDLLKEIKKLPKYFKYEFKLKSSKLIKESNNLFWNKILKLHEVSFTGVHNKKVYILDKVDKFHKDNSLTIYIKARVENSEMIITLDELSKLLEYWNCNTI